MTNEGISPPESELTAVEKKPESLLERKIAQSISGITNNRSALLEAGVTPEQIEVAIKKVEENVKSEYKASLETPEHKENVKKLAETLGRLLNLPPESKTL